MKKNRIYIIIGIVLLVCLIILGYTSYAFLNVDIAGNETSKTSKFLNIPLSVIYSDNSETIKTPDNSSFIPGSTFSKAFTITNTGNEGFSFDIYLENVTNTFERKDDIKYTIRQNGNIVKTDTFPSNDLIILDSQYINTDETLTYEIIIEYKTSTENQIVDSGKTIGARLYFDYSK